MKSKLSVLALGIVGLLALIPSCGADEGTGSDDTSDDGEPCTDDRQCREGRLCSDVVEGDGDGFCENGETCRCAGVGGGTGGASGTGGTAGNAGTGGGIIGGTGGKGGSGGAPVSSALGEPCGADADCGGAPLICLLSNALPSGDGPPNGLCTLPCTADDNCLEFANEAFCVGFDQDANMQPVRYCILACTGGSAGSPGAPLGDSQPGCSVTRMPLEVGRRWAGRWSAKGQLCAQR